MWFTRELFFYVHFCTASSCIRIPIYMLLVYFLELLLHSLLRPFCSWIVVCFHSLIFSLYFLLVFSFATSFVHSYS